MPAPSLYFLDGLGQFRFEVANGEVGVPAGLAVRREVDHIATRQRADRVDVGWVGFEQLAVVCTDGFRAEEAAAFVVAVRFVPIKQAVGDGHPGGAHRLHDLALVGRRQDQRPVVVIHRADEFLLFGGLLELGFHQNISAFLISQRFYFDGFHFNPPTVLSMSLYYEFSRCLPILSRIVEASNGQICYRGHNSS